MTDSNASGRAKAKPIILAYPHATILSLDKGVVHEIAYGATEHYLTYRAFLAEPERYLHHLLKEGEMDEQDEGED